MSPHHFVVRVRRDGSAVIEERHVWEAADGGEVGAPEVAAGDGAPLLKVTLDGYRWERIAEPVAGDFNRRLRAAGSPVGRWLKGETVLAAHFGKELTLLAWAVEEIDPTVMPSMLANWLGLAPEERWWLYTTINATATATQPPDPERGWRKAIRIAFAENPVEAPAGLLRELPPVSAEDAATSGLARRRTKKAPPTAQMGFDLGIDEEVEAYDANPPDANEGANEDANAL